MPWFPLSLSSSRHVAAHSNWQCYNKDTGEGKGRRGEEEKGGEGRGGEGRSEDERGKGKEEERSERGREERRLEKRESEYSLLYIIFYKTREKPPGDRFLSNVCLPLKAQD